MAKLKVFVDGQFVTINAFPEKQTKSFTTSTVFSGGSNKQINEDFNNRCLVRKLRVIPTNSSVNNYVIEFFKSGSFAGDKLEYQATANGDFVDNDVWFHEDEDLVSELHLKITNNSGFSSTFTVELTVEVFA